MYEFLDYVSARYELAIFCNGDEATCAGVIDCIEKQKKYFEFRFYKSHSLFENSNFCIKYYDFLLSGERSLETIVIVEAKVPTYCLHIFNGIPVKPFCPSTVKLDNELIFLAKFLTELEAAASVQLILGTIVRSSMLKWKVNHENHSIGSGDVSSGFSGSIDK